MGQSLLLADLVSERPPEAEDTLCRYPWAGQCARAGTRDPPLCCAHRHPVASGRTARPGQARRCPASWHPGPPTRRYTCHPDALRDALDACGGNRADLARRLDVDPGNLHKLARRLGLK